MKIVSFLFTLLFVQEIPLKPNEEFNLTIDYSFKQRPSGNSNVFEMSDGSVKTKNQSSDKLPYLGIKLKLLKLSDQEVKMRVINDRNETLYSHKAVLNELMKFDWGFMDDIKDKVTSNELKVVFLSSKKQEISKIHLLIQEDGTFLVNGEKRGKF